MNIIGLANNDILALGLGMYYGGGRLFGTMDVAVAIFLPLLSLCLML